MDTYIYVNVNKVICIRCTILNTVFHIWEESQKKKLGVRPEVHKLALLGIYKPRLEVKPHFSQ